MASCLPSDNSPNSAIGHHQATPSRAPRPSTKKTAELRRHGLLGELLPAVFVGARQLGGVSHRQKHRSRAIVIVTDTEAPEERCRRWSMIAERRAFVEVSIYGGPYSWVMSPVVPEMPGRLGPKKVVRSELPAQYIVSHGVPSLSILAGERPVLHRGEFSWSSGSAPSADLTITISSNETTAVSTQSLWEK